MIASDKMPFNKALNQRENDNVAPELKEKVEAQDQPTSADTQAEADALSTPPDPDVPTGILSVIIHQINNRTFVFSLYYCSH